MPQRRDAEYLLSVSYPVINLLDEEGEDFRVLPVKFMKRLQSRVRFAASHAISSIASMGSVISMAGAVGVFGSSPWS